MKMQHLWLACVITCLSSGLIAQISAVAPDTGTSSSGMPAGRHSSIPGIARVWEDRGELTPSKVYWGVASLAADPLSRLPVPPYSHFQKDTVGATPKAKLTDSKGVKWTAKFGPEAHADTAAPRLAWALGFGTVEGYFVGSGTIEGVDAQTDRGHARVAIRRDGTFREGARFKRHDKDSKEVLDSKGHDQLWDMRHNPGVPPEQFSGLLLFDVLVRNWDAQPKNCKVFHVQTPRGPETWYIVSDLGASFADQYPRRFNLKAFRSETGFVRRVTHDFVDVNFVAEIPAEAKVHQRIPLAHAQWFRRQLEKLTENELQAAFDAAFATDALNRAYASGDPNRIRATRESELPSTTREMIAGFVSALRARIDDFLHKVPAGS